MDSLSSGPGLFLPRRIANPTDGILLLGTGGEGNDYVKTAIFCLTAPSVQASTLLKYWTVEFEGGNHNNPMVMMQAGNDPVDALAISVLATKRPDWYASNFYESATKPGKLEQVLDPPLLLAGPGKLLGAGFPVLSPASDDLFTIHYDDVGGQWVGTLRELAHWPPAPETITPLILPASLSTDGVDRPGFAARHGSRYFLSLIDASKSSRTFCWPEELSSQPVELMHLSDPLQAVLSDGTLLTDDGMTSTAFDSSGKRQYAFSSGSLRFIHERYDDTLGAYVMVFTRNLFVRDGREQVRLRIEVLEIPTVRLSELAY